ncbi:MAG: hypothetical protein EOP04_02670 [Proteobacteria bacterium]|nr:MAG: hypothetical protein EOP04_02670 [Pseudomonadota bacterium]
MNKSGDQAIDMNKFAENAASQVKDIFSVSYERKNTEVLRLESKLDNYSGSSLLTTKKVNVTFKVEVEIRVIKNEEELNGNEHLVSVGDKAVPGSDAVLARVDKVGGKRIFVGVESARKIAEGSEKQVMAYELGHTLGLRHINNYDMPWRRLFN